jgi:hypothetical protein
MKPLATLAIIAIVFAAGCTIRTGSGPLAYSDAAYVNSPGTCYGDYPWTGVPPVDLPYELRMKNYSGGSCVHASTEMIMRWQGMEDLAAWWRETYHGGESSGGLINKCEKAGLRFAYTTEGDVGFLDWCSRTKRGATIFYKPSHSICFFGWTEDGRQAILLDNNHIKEHEYVDRETFISKWKGFGGFALTPVYSPAPPRPWL